VKKELYHEALDKLMQNLEVNLDAILILQQAINISVVNTDSILSNQQTNILNDHLPNSINNVSMIIRGEYLKKC
jgi:hypothetical protein